MTAVPDADESQDALSISTALCVDRGGLDLLGRVVRHLAVGLVDQSVHVRLVGPDPRIETLTLGPIQSVVHEPIAWPMAEKRIGRVLEALAHRPPTVVHALTCGSYRIAVEIAEAFDADLVFQVTSVAGCDSLSRLREKRIACYLACSAPLAAILKSQLRIPPERIELVRPGILASKDIACFARPECEATILCTAPFEKDSGVDRLIEAVATLQGRHALLVFLLGEGKQESALRRLARLRGLSACVTFAKPLGDVADAMRSADIFVQPYEDTTIDVDTLQALGVGMAAVTLTNNVCDYVRNKETAIVCDAPTVDSLADAIERLLTDREAARQIAGAGMEYVRAHHAMSDMAERAAAVYRKLALARATFPIKE
ncbi:MAG: glycosyltransferase family 4 protein [Planctomycetota bacterium]|jgi:glycosyltransferase involved in cell wall biosynthesis